MLKVLIAISLSVLMIFSNMYYVLASGYPIGHKMIADWEDEIIVNDDGVWYRCNGQSIDINEYPEIFEKIELKAKSLILAKNSVMTIDSNLCMVVDFGLGNESKADIVSHTSGNYEMSTSYSIKATNDFNEVPNTGNWITLFDSTEQFNWGKKEKRVFRFTNSDKYRYYAIYLCDSMPISYTEVRLYDSSSSYYLPVIGDASQWTYVKVSDDTAVPTPPVVPTPSISIEILENIYYVSVSLIAINAFIAGLYIVIIIALVWGRR